MEACTGELTAQIQISDYFLFQVPVVKWPQGVPRVPLLHIRGALRKAHPILPAEVMTRFLLTVMFVGCVLSTQFLFFV